MRRSSHGAALALLVLLAAGCSGQQSTASPEEPPALGASAPTPASPPDEPMDHVERPIARRLATQVRDEGLTLEHIDCPRWTGALPAALTCDGYLDGVLGKVQVELTRGAGGSVEYDAWLDDGVIASRSLVRRLRSEGYTDADCGDIPAYPARVGLRLVCRVSQDGAASYVVATVTDRSGAVEIRDY